MHGVYHPNATFKAGAEKLVQKSACSPPKPGPQCTPQPGVIKTHFEGCSLDKCHEGWFINKNSCGLVEGTQYLSYEASCTAGCAVSHTKTPTTPKSTTPKSTTPTTPKTTTPTTPKTTGGGSKTTVTVTESKTVTTGALTFEACAPNPKAVAPYGTITVPMTTGGELTAHQYQPTPPIAIWVDVNHVQTVCLATTATCAVYGPNQNIAVVPPQNDNWVTAGDAPVDALLPGPGWAIERQPVTITTIQTTCKTKNGATSCTQQVIGVQSGIQYVETYDPTNCPYLIPVVVPNS
ncbi:MAG: hypothetical protein C7B45_16930 [Sulfobacillus acidophilus]|uniref:Uncharacterized protein n=1 Tax=Sulfobacillus acidophilus TaxID=53633 RepID=A0A2T2WCR1_9FIRM|nr:MAG: hypothetical protein C7B45_16930 [Sulfobacillus acidophilus]